jgi:hypothetical protein
MPIKADLPRQLQRQQEEIEKFDKDIADAASAPATQETSAPPPETPKAPDGQEAPLPVATPATPPPSDDQWKQRFLTLKGKYDAEVPRLHTELKELRTKLEELATRRVETPAEPAKPKSKRVTEKDQETFGADLLDVIKRQAEEIAADALADLQSKVGKLESENEQLKAQVTGVSTTQSQTAQEVYFGKLTTAVPDWEAINVSPGFLEWLGEVDELSGHTRQAFLDEAFQTLNVARTAKLFNAYKKVLAASAPPPPAPTKQEVQRQVAPGKSKTPPGPPASDAASKIWTANEIDRFYQEVRAGHYRNNPAELNRIEAEIDAAVASGRVKT